MILHSAAELLAEYFIVQGALSRPGSLSPWPCFTNAMPNLPPEVAVIYNIQGEMDGREQPTGRTVEHPGFQITLRTSRDSYASKKSELLKVKLDQILRTIVIVETKQYLVQSAKRTTPLIPFGEEEGGGRLLFSMSGTLTYSEV